MRHQRARAALLAAALFPLAAPAAAEFKANTYTTHRQLSPAVAPGADGSFVVVWSSDRQAHPVGGWFGYRYDLVGRRFDAVGRPLGPEFAVSTLTTRSNEVPAVATDAAGHFVVVWRKGGIEAAEGFLGRLFDAAGTAKGAEFEVSGPASYQPADVASDAWGNFVAVWTEHAPSASEIHGRRFDASGTPIGAEFTVGTAGLFGDRAAVAMDADGRFLVTWGQDLAVQARHYDAGGNAGPEFQVNTTTTVRSAAPVVAALDAGQFIVAWSHADLEIRGRPVDAGGPAGPEFVANTRRGSAPEIAGHASGFVIVWVGLDDTAASSGGSQGIFGQRFLASGERDSIEFRVNGYTTFHQRDPSVAMHPDGSFLATWVGDVDTVPRSLDRVDVLGQPFRDDLFADGFDSGDLRAWSAAATDGGDLRVVPRLDGEGHSFALQAVVDDTAPLYVQDDSPDDEGHYRAFFEFDPRGFDPGEAVGAHRVRIFLALETEPTRRVLALVLRRLGGAYALRGRVRLEDGSRADTPFLPITAGPHRLELHWARATRPDSDDGFFALWIDGLLASRLDDLDNPSPGLESVRLGALSVKPGASGALLFDSFVSRRRSAIGPGTN